MLSDYCFSLLACYRNYFYLLLATIIGYLQTGVSLDKNGCEFRQKMWGEFRQKMWGEFKQLGRV